jgi:hypothetical protein
VIKRIAISAAALFFSGLLHAESPQPGPGMIVVRTSNKAPDELVEAFKAHAMEKKWAFLGANKVKNGEITMLKVCIPQVGAALWQSNMQLTALLPCGNVSLYSRDGKTEVAMLHPAYMKVLFPSPETEKAVALAEPQLLGMLDAVTQ